MWDNDDTLKKRIVQQQLVSQTNPSFSSLPQIFAPKGPRTAAGGLFMRRNGPRAAAGPGQQNAAALSSPARAFFRCPASTNCSKNLSELYISALKFFHKFTVYWCHPQRKGRSAAALPGTDQQRFRRGTSSFFYLLILSVVLKTSGPRRGPLTFKGGRPPSQIHQEIRSNCTQPDRTFFIMRRYTESILKGRADQQRRFRGRSAAALRGNFFSFFPLNLLKFSCLKQRGPPASAGGPLLLNPPAGKNFPSFQRHDTRPSDWPPILWLCLKAAE